jgi:hypothetical protein
MYPLVQILYMYSKERVNSSFILKNNLALILLYKKWIMERLLGKNNLITRNGVAAFSKILRVAALVCSFPQETLYFWRNHSHENDTMLTRSLRATHRCGITIVSFNMNFLKTTSASIGSVNSM